MINAGSSSVTLEGSLLGNSHRVAGPISVGVRVVPAQRAIGSNMVMGSASRPGATPESNARSTRSAAAQPAAWPHRAASARALQRLPWQQRG